MVRGAFDLLGLAVGLGWLVGLVVGLVHLDFTSLVVEKSQYETYSPNGSFMVESQKKNSIKQIQVEG